MERPNPQSLPTTPGVYLYKDAQGRIVYVGKARNLRRRVLSYFRPPESLPPKTVAMLGRAVSLETLSVGTEKEALLLEASLIKKHRPRYNVVLRDDKDYVLFRLDEREPYPRLEIVRRAKKDGARLFGPFSSAAAARGTWKAVHKAFPLRRCSDRVFKNRKRPCLYRHLGQCLAPCAEDVPREVYADLVRKVGMLLSGRSKELLAGLRAGMAEASEALEYERAAELRDQIRAVERTVERQSVVLPDGGDMDVVGVAVAAGGLGLSVLFVREGRLVDGRTFFWPNLGLEEAPEVLSSFLGQFYGPGGAAPPARIVVPWTPAVGEEEEDEEDFEGAEGAELGEEAAGAPRAESGSSKSESSDAGASECGSSKGGSSNAGAEAEGGAAKDASLNAESAEGGSSAVGSSKAPNSPKGSFGPAGSAGSAAPDALEAALSDARGAPVRIVLPRSADEAKLVDMAAENAREAASKDAVPMAERLAALFSKETGTSVEPVRRIECADVSHTGGTSTRVGMVVFEDGEPLKSAYRTYAVEGEAAGGDDYSALAEWARRRVESGPPWADLVLVDGGRGQVAAVGRALREAGAEGRFLLAGIAKARDERGRADRRAGNVGDRIFLPGRSGPAALKDGAPELLFLQRVRDEAHRFAVGRHRRARESAALSGELTRIPGIGPATARLLWERFETLEGMLEASEAALAEIPGIGPRRAAALAERLAALGRKRGRRA